MNIVFNCPSCGAILRLKEQYGGQRGRCPHCQGAITVPAIETDAGTDLLPLDDPGSAAPAATPAPAGAFSLGTRLPPAGAPAPASQTPSTSFSLGNRAPAGPAAAAEPHSGDSNIGLAPLEDAPAKHAVAAPVPTRPAKKSPEPEPADEDFSLAPLEAAEAGKVAVKPPAEAAATKTIAKPSDSSADAKTATPTVQPLVVACTKCSAKMRVPPTAAGKTVTCPKCKNKQRVPDAAPAAPRETVKPSTGDTVPLDDLADSGQDLGAGMLGLLDDPASAATDGAAVSSGPPLTSGKLSSSKSSGGLFGLPPLAVYGGAGAVALGLALILVFFLRSPSAAPPGPQSQTPPATPTTSQTSPAPPPVQAQAPVTSPAPTAQSPASAAAPPAATSPAAPQPGSRPGMDQLRAAMGAKNQPQGDNPANASAPMPAATPMPGSTTPPSTPAADPAAWRQRIPLVRLQPDSQPQPGDPPPTVAPREELMNVVERIQGAQSQVRDSLKQMTDLDAARRNAPGWAEQTAQGLDLVRQLRRAGGVPKPEAAPAGGGGGLLGAARRAQAAKAGQPDGSADEQARVVEIESELARLSQVQGVMAVLDAELLARAAREPTSALAAALVQRGVAVPGASAPK